MMDPLCEQITNLLRFNPPAANMVKLYSFNRLWTIITTMFQEKSNTYHISKPIIRRFFSPKLVPLRSLSSSFIDSLSFAMKRCNTSQCFGAFSFSHVIDSCSLFISFISFLFFSLSFLIFLNSGWVFNKTIILLGLAGYQMIITNSTLRALLVIYHSISSAPS